MKDKFRMYGLVPYNLSEIQKGIQFGHAVVEYGLLYNSSTKYKDWATECKTFIILNGGTTNKSESYKGTMNLHLETLNQLGVPLATFHEPDLGDQLTAIVFIVPEEVFNKDMFPDFAEDGNISWGEYANRLGGRQNARLREFLKPFRLA